MATPNERLATSLEQLKELQEGGRRVFLSKELGRVHRERLLENGFLRDVIKGWLISTSPGTAEGDTTPWYASFWEFCARYCNERFGNAWHLSPEQSLLLHAENTVIPPQVVVYSTKGTNNNVELIFGTSLYDLKQSQMPPAADLTVKDGLRLYALPAALIKVPEAFYQNYLVEAQVALNAVRDSSEVLGRLLEGGHSVVAGRLVGAFRRIGRANLADEILKTMQGAGYDIRESDPFSREQKLIEIATDTPPVVSRLTALWEEMRGPVAENFPEAPGLPEDPQAFLKFVEESYKHDAYHSLSIEGYTVTPDLIERVREGNWDPKGNENDRNNSNALAARGYWQTFELVKGDVEKIIKGAPAGELIRDAHRSWYREMFAPSVTAGILKAGALAGYRSHPVYIRGSRHVPPRWESLPDAMKALFDLLVAEEAASVRAVMGHWMLGYIHPYPDGNGRMARLLMNAMLASGGYPWTIIRVDDRNCYMEALEAASVGTDIRPLTVLIAERVGKAVAEAA
ncbi:MAG: Fic family protein [Alphaproteobacteria bacterium]|nr:Fic family protein [Alphaproteobacteria bacterium]